MFIHLQVNEIWRCQFDLFFLFSHDFRICYLEDLLFFYLFPLSEIFFHLTTRKLIFGWKTIKKFQEEIHKSKKKIPRDIFFQNILLIEIEVQKSCSHSLTSWRFKGNSIVRAKTLLIYKYLFFWCWVEKSSIIHLTYEGSFERIFIHFRLALKYINCSSFILSIESFVAEAPSIFTTWIDEFASRYFQILKEALYDLEGDFFWVTKEAFGRESFQVKNYSEIA